MRAIQKSIFTVCLDAPMPRVSDEKYQSRVAAQMLHGGGARWNSGNRWFDKTLQVSLDRRAHNIKDVWKVPSPFLKSVITFTVNMQDIILKNRIYSGLVIKSEHET